MTRIIAFFLLVPSFLFAQAPDKFNYQSIVRDNGGTPITNQSVSFRISILESNITGAVVYSETHQVTTNDFGAASFLVGSGIIAQGDFASIDWGTDIHFMKTELDATGGTNYVEMGTAQLVSVPYALYANEAGSAKNGRTYVSIYEDLTNSEVLQQLEDEVGPYTQYLRIENTSQFNILSLDTVLKLEGLLVNRNTGLTNVNLPNLRSLGGFPTEASISNNAQLLTIDLSSLEFVSKIIDVTANPLLNNVSISSLRIANRVQLTNNPALNSLDLSSLEICQLINVRDNSNLSVIDFSFFDFSTVSSTFRLDGNALSSSTVNDILNAFVAANVTGVSIWLQGQSTPAPPTGQGLIDKQTLIDDGNTVYTD